MASTSCSGVTPTILGAPLCRLGPVSDAAALRQSPNQGEQLIGLKRLGHEPIDSDPLGLWNGRTATDAEGNRATFLDARPSFEAPGVRIYRVVH